MTAPVRTVDAAEAEACVATPDDLLDDADGTHDEPVGAR